MIEIWRDIKDYDGLYQVSNWGRVKSLKYNHSSKERLLKPGKVGWGYLHVILNKNGEKKSFKIHRLVADAFLPNPLNLPQVNHKDEDKTNNFVFLNEDGSVNKEKSNLEWCNNKYNVNYGTRNNRVSKKLTNGKKSKSVLQYTLNGEFIREWPSTMECDRNGFEQSNVCYCCLGKRKSHKGYIWKYKETL